MSKNQCDLDERALIISLKLSSLKRNLQLGLGPPPESELLEMVEEAEYVIDELRDIVRYREMCK